MAVRMPMSGVLKGDVVVVSDQSEGGRLYTRGNFGYPRSGGGVDLDLMEATYLVESRRLDVVDTDGNAVDFPSLYLHSSREVEGFDVRYTAYSDLRGRGLVVKFETGDYDISVFPRGKTMSNSRPEYVVRVVSERDGVDIVRMIDEAQLASEKRKKLLYGVVDEEGDVTYYSLTLRDPAGKVFPEPMDGKPIGHLVKDSVLVFDRDRGEMLRSYGYYGKSILGYRQLSLIESVYLVGKGKLSVVGEAFDSLFSVGESMQSEFRIRYEVYADLRARGLVVKTGFKYGTHFRAYQSSPDDAHARYLIHAVTPDGMKMWPEISRTVRLSGGVRKEILFGLVGKSVEYLEFRWFKP